MSRTAMQRYVASRMRLRHARNRPIRAMDTTVFPIAMVVLLTVVLVVVMLIAARGWWR